MQETQTESRFEMTGRAALEEAAEWLRDAGFRVAINQNAALRPGRQQLVVFHPAEGAREVRRIVFIVDPRAMEHRLSAPRGGG
jgi:hypothetical protein